MKIIKGHDYYDGAGYGVDPGVIFVRKPREIDAHVFTIPKTVLDRDTTTSWTFFIVLIGGEIHPGVMEIRNQYSSRGRDAPHGTGTRDERNPHNTVFHFDPDSCAASFDEIIQHHAQRMVFARIHRPGIHEHFNRSLTKPQRDWMISERIVTGVVENKKRDNTVRPVAIVNSDGLGDLEFYRVVDPATAHMKIASWLGGVLPSAPETVDISNTSRIRKAGFDTRTSFRKPGGEKKPRRRKAKRKDLRPDRKTDI